MYGSINKPVPADQAKKLLPTQSDERRLNLQLRRKIGNRSLQAVAQRANHPAVLQTLFTAKKTERRGSAVVASVPPHSFGQASSSPPPPPVRNTRRHSFLYTLLNPDSKQWQAVLFKRFITTVILVDVASFIASTDLRISKKFGYWFDRSEGIISTYFLLEYVLRLYTITEKPKYSQLGPIWGRLRYMCTRGALLDLFATAPFFLERLTGFEFPRLTYLRVFRLFRILKTEGTVQALGSVYRVMYYNSEILKVSLSACALLVLVTAVLLYYLRPPNSRHSINDDSNVIQGDDFHSIPATLYLSTLMSTGQGGPDNANGLPWYTRAVVLMTAIFSVAMFAIPASMVTWGFEAEAERMARRARRRALRPDDNNNQESESSTSSDDTDTDEEYFRIIAGGDDGDSSSDDDPEDKLRRREIQAAFDMGDSDGDGALTMKEFWRMRGGLGRMRGAEAATDESVNTRLEQRLDILERRVGENAQKLDQILDILQAQKGLFSIKTRP